MWKTNPTYLPSCSDFFSDSAVSLQPSGCNKSSASAGLRIPAGDQILEKSGSSDYEQWGVSNFEEPAPTSCIHLFWRLLTSSRYPNSQTIPRWFLGTMHIQTKEPVILNYCKLLAGFSWKAREQSPWWHGNEMSWIITVVNYNEKSIDKRVWKTNPTYLPSCSDFFSDSAVSLQPSGCNKSSASAGLRIPAGDQILEKSGSSDYEQWGVSNFEEPAPTSCIHLFWRLLTSRYPNSQTIPHWLLGTMHIQTKEPVILNYCKLLAGFSWKAREQSPWWHGNESHES